MDSLAVTVESPAGFHHKVWTTHGEPELQSGGVSEVDKSELTNEESSGDEHGNENPVKCEQENMMSEAGNLERIIDLVSNFWEEKDFPARRYSFNDDIIQPVTPKKGPTSIRMITQSDALPRPNLPVPPPPQLPNLSGSPLELLAAASGGQLDLHWLETFDNATLETLVPRDPHTGRPLTVGSLEHAEGKCRPCIFFLRAKCFKGLRCSFCHFNHQGLRRPVLEEGETSSSLFDLHALLFPATSSSTSSAGGKSKRLRPSKRTREMIKQINEQMLFGDIIEDPNGPAFSISPQTED